MEVEILDMFCVQDGVYACSGKRVDVGEGPAVLAHVRRDGGEGCVYACSESWPAYGGVWTRTKDFLEAL